MQQPWQLQRTRQCVKCPWRTTTDPQTIPRGYSAAQHAALAETIATPGDLTALLTGAPLRVMACHEDEEAICVGWLVQQCGPGNNLQLRLQLRTCTNVADIRLRGPQHERFEDTLPQHKHSTEREG